MELALITLGHFAAAVFIIGSELNIAAQKKRIDLRIERIMAEQLCLPL